MSESFLHYIWQFQFFDKTDLCTTAGESICVLNPGSPNSNAGPDFSGATIRVGDLTWSGSVEIHLSTSGWKAHGHDSDPAYDNVILHVVWNNDERLLRNDGLSMPTLELSGRIDPSLLRKYKYLEGPSSSIPCRKSFQSVPEVVRRAALDRALVQRLEDKGRMVLDLLRRNNGDWNQTAFVVLARNFGFKVNNEPFQQLAESISHITLMKLSAHPVQVEALLFGIAGFLDEDYGDAHYKLLLREFQLLEQKYRLANRRMKRSQWRFMRLRPANFPTVRIAQLAALVSLRPGLCVSLLEPHRLEELRALFAEAPTEYWSSHYRFNVEAKHHELGEESIQNLVINTVVPLWVARGIYQQEPEWFERAMGLLQEVPPEKNSITRRYEDIGAGAANAIDSQSFVALFNEHCQKRNCLNCAVGAFLLKPG